ncbi:hypothetical protein AKO1_004558 [Acrasis kona]|uniref:Nucleotidyltransferase n=1 Tax=Acrasis kona TaxID=1008807 RepID=A0AAW2Z5I4_9EUKA
MDVKQVILEHLKSRNIEVEEILFACVAGSTMYNLSLPGKSDFDYFGVFRAPTKNIVGLTHVPTSLNSHDPDMSIHEVGKFCEQVLSGSPVITQLLFLDESEYELCYCSEEWKELKKIAMNFITVRTVKAYFGHLKSEIKTAQGKDECSYKKCLYHAFRLCIELERLTKGLPPQVRFKEGTEQWNFLMEVRNHDANKKAFYSYMRDLNSRLAEVDKSEPWSDYIEYADLKQTNPNFDILNNWLLKVRGVI